MNIFAKKKKKGFTLIELLVVIAIIGILSGIVLVSMGGARAKARDAVRKSDMRQLISAQEMSYGDNDRYYTCSVLAGDCGGKADNYPSAIGTFMVKTPTDPGTYTYKGLDNTGVGDDQKFCYYATMEKEAASCAVYTSSNAGNVCKTAVPTTLTDCTEAD